MLFQKLKNPSRLRAGGGLIIAPPSHSAARAGDMCGVCFHAEAAADLATSPGRHFGVPKKSRRTFGVRRSRRSFLQRGEGSQEREFTFAWRVLEGGPATRKTVSGLGGMLEILAEILTEILDEALILYLSHISLLFLLLFPEKGSITLTCLVANL